jgi:hypothetical protein
MLEYKLEALRPIIVKHATAVVATTLRLKVRRFPITAAWRPGIDPLPRP